MGNYIEEEFYEPWTHKSLDEPPDSFKRISRDVAEMSSQGAKVWFGNPLSDTVIVNAQGGPETELFVKDFEEILVQYGRIDPDSMFAVNIHQVQTLAPEQFTESEISFEQVVEYGKQDVEMFADTVAYFKGKGKNVIVLRISYGAFLVEDYLAQYGNIADKYVILTGRLDMPQEVWKPFSEGNMIGFVGGEELTQVMEQQNISVRNMNKLSAAFGFKRYTELLQGTNLENMVYAYGMNDEQVGRLSEEELSFLKAKDAQIWKGEGGHMETIYTLLEKSLP